MEALIVDDILEDFVRGKVKSVRAASIIPRVKKVIVAARKARIPVVYVCDAHLESDPEISVWGEHAMKGTKGAQVVRELKPEKGDHVLEKRVYSSFHETGLDLLLREMGVNTVTIVGLYTEICVRHSAADAFYRGYKIKIPTDCVEAFTEKDQIEGLDYLRNMYGAKLLTSEELIKQWRSRRS